MDRTHYVDYGMLLLRIAVGVIFMAHGAQKIFGIFGGSGVDGFSQMLAGLGFTRQLFWAWAIALLEALGGLFLLLGVLPRTSAGLISIIMLVAIVKVHGPKGFFMSEGGFEYQLLILMTCLTIMFVGAGKISLFDRF